MKTFQEYLIESPMPVSDALRTLGLQHGFTADQLKAAYREKSRQNHPDLGGSTEAMKNINLAHETLSKMNGSQSGAGAFDWQAHDERAREFAKLARKALEDEMHPEVFTRHFRSIFEMPFEETVKHEEHRGTIWASYEWHNNDRSIVLDMRVSVDFTEMFRTKAIADPTSFFNMTIVTNILYNRKKVKLSQKNYKFDRSKAVLTDPSQLFPADKLKAQAGKSGDRRLSKRDVLLSLEKELGARIDYSGQQIWAVIPIGANGQSNAPWSLYIYRVTYMGAAAWMPYFVYEGRKRMDAYKLRVSTVAERPDAMNYLMDELKKIQKTPPTAHLFSSLETMVNHLDTLFYNAKSRSYKE